MVPTPIIMPKLGESVVEGIIERWLKAEGEVVRKDEPLAEISTDKVTAEIPSPVTGTLRQILVPAGQTVAVNAPIAVVEAAAAVDSQAGYRAAVDGPGPASAVKGSTTPPPGADTGRPDPELSREEAARRRSTPLVRRLVAQHGLTLAAIPGTGFGGRVRREDVIAHLEGRAADASTSAGPPPPVAEEAAARRTGTPATLVPLTAVRRIIADRLTQSRLQVPDATAVFEIDMTAVVQRRATVREDFRRRTGVDLTYLPFAIKAVAAALRAYPAVNVSFTIDGILAHQDVHIGIPVAVDGGREPGSDVLVVPVVRHADRLTLAEIALALHDLAGRARAGTLRTDELNGATFTVNNTGAVGTVVSTPIIPQPQAGIMTTEVIVKRPVVVTDATGNDCIAIRSMMFACLTFDHRAFDGLTAGRFMGQVKSWLETSAASDTLY